MYPQTPRTKPVLEIIPETPFVVFHGDQHAAEPVKLRGLIRMDAPESMTIKRIKIRLEGKRKVGWYIASGISGTEVADRKTFFNEERSLGTGSTHKTRPGTIEWPFEFTLNPDMPESVEGTDDTFVVYNLYAQIERPNWKTKDLHAQAHIRIVRTMTHEQLEAARSRVNADIWANKISYSISIPADAVVFGTSIVADVDLSPLRKGIKLGKVSLRLTEHSVKRIMPLTAVDVLQERIKQEESEVARHEMEFPENSRVTFDHETTDNPTMEDERYHFKARLPLPKSLKQCRQDVDTHPIAISHKLKLMVNIHNPEGHVSQLVCRLPVRLFISPHLPIGESNEVQAGLTSLTEEQLNNQETLMTAPPNYGEHHLDELYSDIAPSGYQTSAHSGAVTPIGILSRRSSNDNLNGEYRRAGIHEMSADQISSALLSSRLASLEPNGSTRRSPRSHGTSPLHSPRDHSPRPGDETRHASPLMDRNANGSSSSSSANASADQSRRASVENGPIIVHTDVAISATASSSHSQYFPVFPLDEHGAVTTSASAAAHTRPGFDVNALSRIPSYGTALRSNNPVSPYGEHPPSYMEATSRPPSPSTSPRAGQMLNHSNIPRTVIEAAEPVDQYGESALAGDRPALSRVNSNTGVEDGDARLRMLRGRA